MQVHLQTQQEVKRRMIGMAIHVVKNDGPLALYNGLSASLCRQVRLQVRQNVNVVIIFLQPSDGLVLMHLSRS